MVEKSQHRSKTPREPRDSPSGSRVGKLPRNAATGRFVILKPSKSKPKTLVAELARAGVYLAVPKGSSKSGLEKKLTDAVKRVMPAAALTQAAAQKAVPEEQPRARLVGTGLSRSGKTANFPWANAQELYATIDIADTLSSSEIAERLNTNRETIGQWRAIGRLLGVEGAKRGVRYPTAQLGKNLAPLAGIKAIIEALDGDHWEAWRFLAGEIDELESMTGFDALRAGRLEELLEVLEARSHGSFS